MTAEHYHKRLEPLYKRMNCDSSRHPLPIDPDHPERGLWGMLKGVKVLEESKNYCVLWIDEAAYEASDPTTAMLIALMKQEGENA